MHILLDNVTHPQQQGATANVTPHDNDTNIAGGHTSENTSIECNGVDNTVNAQNLLFDGMLSIYFYKFCKQLNCQK